MTDEVSVGKIGAPWGVKGFMKLHSYSGETDHLKKIRSATLRKGNKSQTITFDAVDKKHGEIIVKISGIDDRDEVKQFSGWELWVPKKNAARKRRGEHYISDLIGCEVFCEGDKLGSVTGVSDIGYVDLIEISTEESGRSLVPFKDEYFGKVDTKGRKIELKTRWLID